MSADRPKSRAAAAALTILAPGVGHAYLGLVRRAVLWSLAAPVVALALAFALPEATRGVLIAVSSSCSSSSGS